jgi:NTE family protein
MPAQLSQQERLMAEIGGTALVLGGGAIKGAFQAGALKYILGDYGMRPSYIYGISVGALNGALIADRAGAAINRGKEPDWRQIGEELYSFWQDKITQTRDIVKPRFPLLIALHIFLKRFKGIVKPDPLHALVRQEIHSENLKQVAFGVGTVDIKSGKIHYISTQPHYERDMVEYVIASAALPIAMPIYRVGTKDYYDGGLIDVAPVNRAIDRGASKIVCVLCQSEELLRADGTTGPVDTGDLGELFQRVSDILTNEIVLNDIKILDRVNQMVDVLSRAPGPVPEALQKYRKIHREVIRPQHVIEGDLLKFDRQDIQDMLDLGYTTARHQLETLPLSKSAGMG